MKPLQIFLLCILLGSFCHSKAQRLGLYLLEDERLHYAVLDVRTTELVSKEIDRFPTDVVSANAFQQQNDWLVFSNWNDGKVTNKFFRAGKYLCKDTVMYKEWPIVNINRASYLVMDHFVDPDTGTYQVSILDSCQTHFSFTKHDILQSADKNNLTDTSLLVFFGEHRDITLEPAKGLYILQLIDVYQKKQWIIDSIYEGNFGDEQGFFLWNDSHWMNSQELSYLLYKPVENRVDIKIYGYDVPTRKKQLIQSFSIPTAGKSLHFRYTFSDDGRCFISTGDGIYQVDDKGVRVLLKLGNQDVVGMAYLDEG